MIELLAVLAIVEAVLLIVGALWALRHERRHARSQAAWQKMMDARRAEEMAKRNPNKTEAQKRGLYVPARSARR